MGDLRIDDSPFRMTARFLTICFQLLIYNEYGLNVKNIVNKGPICALQVHVFVLIFTTGELNASHSITYKKFVVMPVKFTYNIL